MAAAVHSEACHQSLRDFVARSDAAHRPRRLFCRAVRTNKLTMPRRASRHSRTRGAELRVRAASKVRFCWLVLCFAHANGGPDGADGRRCDALGRAEAEGLTLHGLARVLHRGGESGQRAVGRSNRDLRVRIRAGELGDDRDRQFLQRHASPALGHYQC